jgi:hypothetical protein
MGRRAYAAGIVIRVEVVQFNIGRAFQVDAVAAARVRCGRFPMVPIFDDARGGT